MQKKANIKKIETIKKGERICLCLILPKIVNKELVFEEVKESDLFKTAQSAAVAVKELLNMK